MKCEGPQRIRNYFGSNEVVCTRVWQQVIEENTLKPGARLPPLLLLVLYNGVRDWKAPTRISELVALSTESSLWPWQPEVRYYLLNIGSFPKDDLARRSSIAALLFRLEQPLALGELGELLGEVLGWFREHEGYEQLRGLFAELVREAFAGLRLSVPITEDMLQMKTRISTLGEIWKQEWKDAGLTEGRMAGLAEGRVEGRVQGRAEGHAEGHAEGRVEGRAEGIAEGRAQGKAEALVCLLTERFGGVTPSLRKRIRTAKPASVECWFKRAVVAPDLLSVFARLR